MALEVEDGTGKINADSYASIATADAYHLAMGNAAWTGADAVKEVALRRATQYIDNNYLFQGEVIKYNQALQWPRWNVYYNNAWQSWPIARVVNACCELALRALSGELTADVDDQQDLEITVGPITVKSDRQRQSGQVRYEMVDQMLSPFTLGGAGRAMRIERA